MIPYTFTLCLIFALTAEAACPAEGCGPNGKCTNTTTFCKENCVEKCRCDPGFDGNDCSFVVDVCPDSVDPQDSVSTCFNGGECVSIQVIEGKESVLAWRCDCSKATGEAAAYAGHQCEYGAVVSCVEGTDESSTAFCVNDGICAKLVRPNAKHPGCRCATGEFEGRHCQYAKGTAPEEELLYAESLTGDDDGVSGVGIFFIVLAALLVTGGAAFYVWKHRSHIRTAAAAAGKTDLNGGSTGATGDLQLEETSKEEVEQQHSDTASEKASKEVI